MRPVVATACGVTIVLVTAVVCQAQEIDVELTIGPAAWATSGWAKTADETDVQRPLSCVGSTGGWGWDDWVQGTVYLAVDGQILARRPYAVLSGGSASVQSMATAGLEDLDVECGMTASGPTPDGGRETLSTQQHGRIEARRPQELRNVPEEEQFTYRGPGDYLRRRVYQVIDNYGLPWTYAGQPASESFFIDQSENGCDLPPITTSDATLNNQGRFEDKLGIPEGSSGIPACAPPRVQTCVTRSTQHVWVAGVHFEHPVTWRCNDVEIGR